MNTKRPSKIVNAEGSLIVVVAVFTAIAAFSAGSVMTAMNSYIRINHRAHNYEKAFFLADAGLAAALVELNNGGAGEIHPT